MDWSLQHCWRRMYAVVSVILAISCSVQVTVATPGVHDKDTVDKRYAPSIEDNEVPQVAPPSDDCAILNQVQSVVIQILNTHYEYGKGIHMLHNIVDGIQDDFSVLKNKLDEVAKQVYAPGYNGTASKGGARLAMPTLEPHLFKTSAGMSRAIQTISWNLRNLTNTVNSQDGHFRALETKYVGLRRKMKKVIHSSGHTRALDDKGALMEHYMDKQTDINTKLLQRIQLLEQRLRTQDDQQDSPLLDSGNGCPIGFVRHFTSCYKFSNESVNWIDAEKRCQGYHHDAHLVSIETSEEAEYVVHYRIHNREHWTSRYIWTGGNDMAEEGTWRWVGTGAQFSYVNWRPGQPDNHNEDQHCMYLRADGADPRWDDWHCHAARLNFICEVNMGSS